VNVEIAVDEAGIGALRVGQNVTFSIDAYPCELFAFPSLISGSTPFGLRRLGRSRLLKDAPCVFALCCVKA
jgi:hypothetical protein